MLCTAILVVLFCAMVNDDVALVIEDDGDIIDVEFVAVACVVPVDAFPKS